MNKHYYTPGDYYRIERLTGGMINETYKVWDSEHSNPYILQVLGTMFDERVVEDYGILSDRLLKFGWEIPKPLMVNGSYWHHDTDHRIKRYLSYIDSTGTPNPETLDFSACGALLAHMHKSLAAIEYQPRFALPQFHDTAYHMDLLYKTKKSGFKSDEAAVLASEVLQEYSGLPKSKNDSVQLIHGDPRVANMLFRGNTPFTLIDWDTVMRDSIFVDIGDAVRSLVEETSEQDFSASNSEVSDYLLGYHDVLSRQNNHSSYSLFCQYALHYAKKMALELGARFLNDSESEQGYFLWESNCTQNRSGIMLANAKKQFFVYQSITELEKEIV